MAFYPCAALLTGKQAGEREAVGLVTGRTPGSARGTGIGNAMPGGFIILARTVAVGEGHRGLGVWVIQSSGWDRPPARLDSGSSRDMTGYESAWV